MLPINGYLRDSVLVNPTPTGVELQFSVWSIELPLALLESSEKLFSFFRREISSSELEGESSDVRNLLSVLSYQGCLIPAQAMSTYKLPEVKPLCISFCNEFYGRYYAHSLWKTMRSSDIPISIIRQWISRTYFLSRFAGVTASAASRSAPNSEIKLTFQKSAVEEYSHCEDYYYPPAKLFPREDGYICGISPAACFIAFDQQMLRIAQQDWLAHIFVALFQERTAQFRDGAHRLYLRVEEQLGLPGLFNGWRTHISFDEENSHAGDLEDLFEQDIAVSHEQLQRSFDEAALTIDLLIDGLEEVLRLGGGGKNPRASVSDNVLKAHHLEGIRCLSEVPEYTIMATNTSELAIELTELIASTSSGFNFLSRAAAFVSVEIEHCLVRLSTECLEYCESHDEIISVGGILEAALRAGVENKAEVGAFGRSGRVIQNFLSRKAKRPSEFIFVVLLFARLIEEGSRQSDQPVEMEVIRSIADSLRLVSKKSYKPEQVVEYMNEALCSIALLEYARTLEDSERKPTIFAVGHQHEGVRVI